MKRLVVVFTIISLILAGCSFNESKQDELNVYTTRDYEVDMALYKEFEKESGIKVNVVELDSAELFAKISTEKDAVADLIFVSGAEYLYNYNELGVLKDIDKPDSSFDDSYFGSNWRGVVGRTRSVAVSKDSEITINDYSDLSSDELNDQINVRSSSNAYNQAWVAYMISVHGEEYTKSWLEGFVNNFARDPEGNDRDQIKAVNDNVGSVAIANSYYMYKLHSSTEQSEVEAAEAVKLANLDNAFLNISWMGKISDDDNAQKLIDFMSSKETQQTISDENGEYPLNKDAKLNEYIASAQDVNLGEVDYEDFGSNIELAYKLMLESGWK